MPEFPHDLLSPAEAAERLGVSDQTIRNQVKSHNLRAVRVGGRFKIDPADLDEFVQHYGPSK